MSAEERSDVSENSFLESFIDAEYECALATADAEIETDVGALFEFPAVAYTAVGEEMTGAEFGKFRENGAETAPYDNAVATPYVLAQL